MSMRDRFKVNATLAAEGVWVEYEPNKDKTIPRFLLARMTRHNKKYSRAFREATKQYATDDKGIKDFSESKDGETEKMLLDVFLDTVLLNWENFQPEDDGKAIPFSKENGEKYIGSDDWMDLYDDLNVKANKAATFNVENMEKDAKN